MGELAETAYALADAMLAARYAFPILGLGAGGIPFGAFPTITDANDGPPLPVRHASCASQQAIGPPGVLQCSAQLSQTKQTRAEVQP